MPKTSTEDQIKLLRSEFKEVKVQAFMGASNLKSLENKVKIFETTLDDFQSEVKNQFKIFEQMLFDWKSEIHTLIDNGFSKPAKDLQEEVEILNVRSSETRERVDKLESIVYKN